MAKRILISGLNKLQCTRDFWEQQELQVVPSHYSLIRCLEDMGWVVEQREIELGEDLSGYDEVVMYVHNVTGYAHALYSGLYGISARPDCILAFDDWQVREMFQAMSKFVEHVENGTTEYSTGNSRIFKDYVLGIQMRKRTRAELEKYLDRYVDGCRIVLARKNRMLISAFAGGDLSLLGLGWPPDRIFRFNPNPFHYNRTPSNEYGCLNPMIGSGMIDFHPSDKSERWTFASLLHNKTERWLKRQGATWPVDMFGQRKGENRTQRITEDEMCQLYNSGWGHFMPGYHHSGSGWWRARPLQVADAGSILVCDDAEGAIFSEAHVGVRASDVEAMDLTQRIGLAARQKEGLYDRHPLDRSVTRAEISEVLEASR